MMERLVTTAISLSTPEYQQHLESGLTMISSEDETAMFGRRELRMLDRIDEPWLQKIYNASSDELRTKFQGDIVALRQSLRELSPYEARAIDDVLLIDYPELIQTSEEPTEEETEDVASPIETLLTMEVDDFTDFLRRYNAASEEVFDDFNESINLQKANYLERFKNCIEAGQLPDVLEQVARKLSFTRFTPVDAFTGMTEQMSEFAGWFSLNQGKAAVRLITNKEYRKNVFIHEATHAVAGRTAKRHMTQRQSLGNALLSRVGIASEKFKDDWGYIRDSRSGLRSVRARHRWLDEAVTEHVTHLLTDEQPVSSMDGEQVQELMKGPGLQAYLAERELLAALLESGKTPIDLRTILDAYFEDYEPNKPKGLRAEKRTALHAAITDAYGPGFLVKLDAYMAKQEATMTQTQAVKAATRLIRLDPALLDTDLPNQSEVSPAYQGSVHAKVAELGRNKHVYEITILGDDRQPTGEIFQEISLESKFKLPGGMALTLRASTDQNDTEKGVYIDVQAGDLQIQYRAHEGLGKWMRMEARVLSDPLATYNDAQTITTDASFEHLSAEMKRYLAIPGNTNSFSEGELETLENLLTALLEKYTPQPDEIVTTIE